MGSLSPNGSEGLLFHRALDFDHQTRLSLSRPPTEIPHQRMQDHQVFQFIWRKFTNGFLFSCRRGHRKNVARNMELICEKVRLMLHRPRGAPFGLLSSRVWPTSTLDRDHWGGSRGRSEAWGGLCIAATVICLFAGEF